LCRKSTVPFPDYFPSEKGKANPTPHPSRVPPQHPDPGYAAAGVSLHVVVGDHPGVPVVAGAGLTQIARERQFLVSLQ